ncbi:MAG: hypothetical protein ACE5ED_03720 [Rhodothalassiaceae bacterium]
MSRSASAQDAPAPGGRGETAEELPAAGAERRLTLRAYTAWEAAAGERPMPAPGDLEDAAFAPFRDQAFRIVFADGDYLEPRFADVGTAIIAETGPVPPDTPIRDVPQNALLSRLADYYLQAIAHKAPVGFEAEYDRNETERVLYRGILLPFAADGETVEQLLGVLSWKVAAVSEEAVDTAAGQAAAAAVTAEAEAEETEIGLQAVLAACRSAVERLKEQESRSHEALYAALAKTYAFFLLSVLQPAPYEALLREAGIRAQARAPLTPVLKLVFGRDYPKARLTEYAAALSYLRRLRILADDVRDFIAGFEGGLKGLVLAERAVRREERGAREADRQEQVRRRLAAAPGLPVERAGVRAPGGDEFVLLLARRTDAAHVEPVAVVEAGSATLARTMRRAAAQIETGARPAEAGDAKDDSR